MKFLKSTLVFAVLFSGGCAVLSEPPVPPAQDKQWTPPPELQEQPAPELGALPADFIRSAGALSLPQLIDLALRNSQKTKASWLQARAAAESLKSASGSYFPQLALGAHATRDELPFRSSSNRFDVDIENQSDSSDLTYGPYISLTYLLFDFGRREATVDSFRQALHAADFQHNAELQQVILDVQRSFYSYVSFRSLARAQDKTIEEAKRSLDAAENRRSSGVATVAEVLQAKTALSQSILSRQETEGQIQSLRGLVATAVGISPAAPFDVEEIDFDNLPVTEISRTAEEILTEVQRTSPDLAALRAQAEQAAAQLRAEERRRYPALTADVRAESDRREDEEDSGLTGTVQLEFPLFTGFSLTADIERARRLSELAQSRAESGRQQVALNVWTNYFNVQRAVKQMQTAKDLLASAGESLEVETGRYKEGVGTIVELLSAQAALEQARASDVRAKSDWLLSLAQLQRDAGTFDPERERRRNGS